MTEPEMITVHVSPLLPAGIGLIGLGGYLLRYIFYGISTGLSHYSAYTILENIRLSLTRRLMKAPLGIVLDESAGKLKSVIVDRVETIELPLAHMIPECISNFLLPVAVLSYLVTIDWRMALAMLITVPIAGIAYAYMMKSFNTEYANYMDSNNYVNDVILEYVEGIEVIKAFNQSPSSYEKYTKAVESFKIDTLKWYQRVWKPMNFGNAVLPSTFLGTLPIGLFLYLSGTLHPQDLVMCLILSMGIVGPLMNYNTQINKESVIYKATATHRIRLGDILKRVSLGFFSRNNLGELSSAVTTDLSFMELVAMSIINTVVNGYIMVSILIIFLTSFCPLAGAVSLTGLLVSSLLLYIMRRHSRINALIHQKAQDIMVEATIEYLRGMQVIKAFKQEGVSIDGIRKAYKDGKEINIKIEIEHVPFNCLYRFSLMTASIGIVAVAALLTTNGSMDIPIMLMLDMFSFMMFTNVEYMNNAVHVLETINATLDKLDRIEQVKSIDQEGKNITLKNYDVRFQNVSFAYDQKTVLQNINFELPQGSTTTIVGPSGSGKTTICNLIGRFYDVNEGKVLVGGVHPKECSDCHSGRGNSKYRSRK
ncbi:MAG: ABC transporter transmembrane domain-containing protein [Lachnospiraceae bacterium]